jgi:hypothetical protein
LGAVNKSEGGSWCGTGTHGNAGGCADDLKLGR